MTFRLVDLPGLIPANDICLGSPECSSPLQPDRIGVPYAYQDYPQIYNPSTTSQWAVFYATNPNPEVYQGYSQYCAGEPSKFSVVIESSYGQIRVWKFNAFSLDQSQTTGAAVMTWAFDGFNGVQTRQNCGALFNMTVVALEYINEYNVAVTVLQASMQSFDVITRLPRVGYTGYQYQVYFVNPTTNEGPATSMYQELVPQSLLSEGMLCPSQRRMPDIGSSVAESWAGVFYFMQLPLNAVVLFPAIFSGGDWAGFTRCPSVTLGHSLLLNCGQGILNADLAFEAWHRSSFLFYQSFVKIAVFGQDLSPSSPILLMARQAVVGSSTAAAYIDPGSPKFMQGLLGAVDFNKPFADLSHAMLFSMPPWIRVFSNSLRFGTGGMQMFLHFMELLIFDYVLKLAAGEKISVGIFYVITAMRDDVEQLLVAPALQICDGTSLMFGYSNPPASVLRYFCRVGATSVLDLFDFLNVFFVDFPIVNCVCGASQGKVFASYIQGACYPWTPVKYRPLLAELLSRSEGDRALMCSMVVNMTNRNLSTAFDPTFTAMYEGYTSIGSVFDYFLVFLDPASGTCDNYYTSDYVMAIMPEPIDYFTMCYTTRLCELTLPYGNTKTILLLYQEKI
eukprot:726561-Hanusia_phi.AAC.1